MLNTGNLYKLLFLIVSEKSLSVPLDIFVLSFFFNFCYDFLNFCYDFSSFLSPKDIQNNVFIIAKILIANIEHS